jgi:3'-phosphoadenosine 5'-phosphosulfate sulfotransferase (PAPS reductase)/FAD synthetase
LGDTEVRVFSFGGGVQSMAALVLAAQGRIEFPVFLFCNVGHDSENPDTLAYFRDVALPFAAEHGIELHEVARTTNNGETLYQRTLREERSIGIPAYMAGGAPGNRSCTQAYKRDVVRRWLGKGNHVVGLGISLDEYRRMRTDSGNKNIINEYPLIDMRYTRQDCRAVIVAAGLPVPPKSACWFCPFHRHSDWQDLKREKPELFQKAVDLEQTINHKRAGLGKDDVYLHSRAKPLSQVVADQPLLFKDEESCESGYCMV